VGDESNTAAADGRRAVREVIAELIVSGASAALVVELSSETGRLAPAVFVHEPPSLTLPELDLEGFAALARSPGFQHQAAASAFESTGAAGTFFAIPVRVEPAFAEQDTLLIVAGLEGPELEALIRSAKARLEPLLSARRVAALGRLLLAAVDQAADAIEITDRSARVVFVNRTWQRVFGYSSVEALGRYASELVRDKARPAHESSFYRFTEKRVTAGEPWIGVLTSATRHGETHLNEVTVSPFEGDFRGNFVVRRDVAHRAQRDTALLSAHTEFRGVLSAIPDGVTVLRDGLIYYANAAFLVLVGHDDQSIVGLPFADLIAEEDREDFARRDASDPSVVRMHSRDSGMRIVEISAAGSISFEGEPATILLARDITERRIAEEQLARAERFAALGELAAGVAHELNNPMAYVLLNLELMRTHIERNADAALHEPVHEALDGVRRMKEIATELRAFSRSDGPGELEAVDVQRAVNSAVNIAQNQIRHRAEVRRELGEGLFVAAREGQLVQVLVNLLLNAAQAIPEGDERRHVIGIRARKKPDNRVEISVDDTGPGFPAEILPRLFHPFATTKARGQGSGLGLAISRRIVERFKGEIRAENQPGGGAILTFHLPAAGPSAGPPSVRQARERPRERGLKVLVVDDEPAIGRALRRVLAAHQLTVLSDGYEAIEHLYREAFDVIVCDLMMPGLSGHKLFETVCEVRPELRRRFVFISGGAVTSEAASFLDKCECPVLPKPFSNIAVVEAVERVASGLAAPAAKPS
jgi:two-component system, cell cycle sensor histidine kinase and response regulator CckA